MLIHEPGTTRTPGGVRVSARVEFVKLNPNIRQCPDALWFEVDEPFAEYLTDRADAFLVAMLPIAMAQIEDLEVRGVVSPRLMAGINDYQSIQTSWWPKHVDRIEVSAERIEPPSFPPGKAVATCFSGGVDSTYSLWKHSRGEASPASPRLTHALMINGFDLDARVEEPAWFAAIDAIYRPMFRDASVELVTIRTNISVFRNLGVGRASLRRSFGTATTACGLVLAPLFARLYLPGSLDTENLIVEGCHPATDFLLSTESTIITHDGVEASRLAKTRALADWPLTCDRLRVCSNPNWRNIDVDTRSVRNCSRCDKCVRTMTTLSLLSRLDRFTSFGSLDRSLVRNSPTASPAPRAFARENLTLARARRRHAMAFDLQWALVRGFLIRTWKTKFGFIGKLRAARGRRIDAKRAMLEKRTSPQKGRSSESPPRSK